MFKNMSDDMKTNLVVACTISFTILTVCTSIVVGSVVVALIENM